ncbi:MAG TPA: chemotaxis protein CheX [Candidatus Cloacimonadota bacterium]|nr:chemotaxis protein CheX [Candidatus Cloacimonadota bacterium]HPK41836.1 chemotaxis protein CheX [Candidatus Cloacimonadota bacterium]
MNKALFLDLKDNFSLYSIVESKTFKPTFEDWSEDLLNNLSDYSLIIIYQEAIDNEIIHKIRRAIAFRNKKLLVFTNSITLDIKKASLSSGADFVELLPLSDEELINYLIDIKSLFDKSNFYNTNLLNPFVLSVQEVLSMMAMLNIEVVDTYLGTTQFHYADVSGIMALAGDQKGIIMISFYEALSNKIISSIMGLPIEEITEEEQHDGVGELINMIAGGAKARLGDSDWSFLLSAPTVITGNQHRVIQQKDIPCVIMVFSIDDENFAVQLCLNFLMQRD